MNDRVLNDRNLSKLSVKGPDMVRALEDAGVWYRDIQIKDENIVEGRVSSERKRAEAVYYQRDFVDKWLENKWVEKDQFGKKYILTDDGQKIIDTFYV